ncbi:MULTISPECIES: hypothetical protein [unclassified Sphingobacterium]|uniref:hypothetical protein n=1 Tax=unclassified Sphingobacterium TaxID=2609468 RepID=UPI0020C27CAC|nr:MULTISPECIES: hypothetical protein [unclassified Sphingobacterium]
MERLTTKELLGKVALANGYSCMAEMSVTMSDKDIRIAVLKYQLDESQSQTQDLQEHNAELVEMLEDVKGYLGSDKRNEVDTLLTKYNHLKSNTNGNTIE